jgi:hypothetical protein
MENICRDTAEQCAGCSALVGHGCPDSDPCQNASCVALSRFEEDRILDGQLNEAIHALKHRIECTEAEAKERVHAEARDLGLLGEKRKFEGYCENLPIKKGMEVTILKGTMVYSTGHDPKPAGRTYKVKVHHTICGSNQYLGYHNEVIPPRNPRVCWAGSGNYWTEVDINDVPEAQ